jgi:hypothetical protein
MRPFEPVNRIGWRLDRIMADKGRRTAPESNRSPEHVRRENSKVRIAEAWQACLDGGHQQRAILVAAEMDRASITKWTTKGLIQKREHTLDRFALAVGVEVESIFTDALRYLPGRQPGSLEHWRDAERRLRGPGTTMGVINPSRQQLHADLDALLDSPEHASAISQVIRSMRASLLVE